MVVIVMEFQFKDKKSKTLFKDTSINQKSKEEMYFLDEMLSDNEVEVSSSLDLNSLEALVKNGNIVKKEKEPTQSEENKSITHNIDSSQLNRIESKQNAILEILESMPTPSMDKIILEESSKDDEEILKLNLELFNNRLIILSTDVKNNQIKNLLVTLESISDYLFSNSFNIFSRDNSPVKLALKEINIVGMGDATLNNYIHKTEKLLEKIDGFGKMQIFERSYSFANLLLEKRLLLNAITILNEVTGMYIVESMKSYSKNISKYTQLYGEEDTSKLYSQAKEFFSNLFSDKESKILPIFPNHKVAKDMDKEIARKFQNIEKTWRNRGDVGLFKRYTNITIRIRYIRNSVAHADMENSFKSIYNELKILNDDFFYLAIQKNILKK
jgi:hypothetical protein